MEVVVPELDDPVVGHPYQVAVVHGASSVALQRVERVLHDEVGDQEAAVHGDPSCLGAFQVDNRGAYLDHPVLSAVAATAELWPTPAFPIVQRDVALAASLVGDPVDLVVVVLENPLVEGRHHPEDH